MKTKERKPSAIFNDARKIAEQQVRKKDFNTVIEMSGSLDTRTGLIRALNEYRNSSRRCLEFGIIDQKKFEFEGMVAGVLTKSIAHYKVC